MGIGGIGMSGISEVLLNQGYKISGSDIAESEMTKRLSQLGARISIGHEKSNIYGANVVVISSAVKQSNPEVVEARRLRIPVIPRAEMLGELMRGKIGIAVAGSHGKTTTTSMLATIFSVSGADPTIVIGGRVDSLGGNAKFGHGSTVIVEADESDGSFLYLPATFAVITNIDNDHLDYYLNTTAIESAFIDFVSKLPFYGFAAVCGDDPGIKKCLGKWRKPVVTYGLSADWDYFARAIAFDGLESRFEVLERNPENSTHHRLLGEFQLKVPGIHNVLNAVSAIVIARKFEIPVERIQTSLYEFQGVRRRFEMRWSDQLTGRAIIEDYGHHPTEILATLKAARAYWKGRLITVFQPHRFSRTLTCWDDFARSFGETDIVLVLDVYPAGEEALPGTDPKDLSEKLSVAIRKHSGGPTEVVAVGNLESAKLEVLKRFQNGDLVLCLGAGSITKLPEALSQAL